MGTNYYLEIIDTPERCHECHRAAEPTVIEKRHIGKSSLIASGNQFTWRVYPEGLGPTTWAEWLSDLFDVADVEIVDEYGRYYTQSGFAQVLLGVTTHTSLENEFC